MAKGLMKTAQSILSRFSPALGASFILEAKTKALLNGNLSDTADCLSVRLNRPGKDG